MLHLILANVLTQNPAAPKAKAVLVCSGRILAVGDYEDLRPIAPKAELLDYRGYVLTPGLVDAHIHLLHYGFSLNRLQLAGSKSIAEVQSRLKTFMAASQGWIIGGGFNLSEMGLTDYPTAAVLDEICPERPVMLYSSDVHSAWVNSKALELAGIGELTPNPEQGEIVRHNGKATGYFLERAKELVVQARPEPTWQETLDAIRTGADAMREYGYTGAHNMGYEPPESVAAMQYLADDLPLRMWVALDHPYLPHLKAAGIRGGFGGKVKISGIKFFSDGALGSRIAWLHGEGYTDGTGTGIPLDSMETIFTSGKEALAQGFIPTVHAIGDRANHEVLNVFERLKPFADRAGVRLRLEHAQHLSHSDIPRFAALNVTASMQPMHMLSDAPTIRELIPHLAATSYACRSLLDSGALLAFGSDAPVADPNPLHNFKSAVERIDNTGKAFVPEQALTLAEVLYAHTRGAALAVGATDYGIVQVGAVADFTLWDELGKNPKALTL